MMPFFDDDEFFDDLLLMGAAGGGKSVEATATGNPLTFVTDLAKPLRSLLIPFTPVQSGTGDPSPQNIRSILPWNGLKVFGGGKNLFVLKETEMISIGWNRFFPNPIKKAGTYTISCKHSFGGDGNDGARVVLTDATVSTPAENKILTAWTFGQSANGSKSTFTVTEEDLQNGYILFECAGSGTGYNQFVSAELQIEVGETATEYEPYTPITETDISFPSPVYGGTLDVVSGVLTVTHELWTKNTATMDNSVNYPGWKDSGIKALVGEGLNATFRDQKLNVGSLFAVNTTGVNDVLFLPKEYGYGLSQDEWIALAIDVQIAVPLATPQEITLTPEQITALKGNNTIWSDADWSMTAVYLKKG